MDGNGILAEIHAVGCTRYNFCISSFHRIAKEDAPLLSIRTGECWVVYGFEHVLLQGLKALSLHSCCSWITCIRLGPRRDQLAEPIDILSYTLTWLAARGG